MGDGKVGIGTTAPDTLLHLEQDGARLKIESKNAKTALFERSESGTLELRRDTIICNQGETPGSY